MNLFNCSLAAILAGTARRSMSWLHEVDSEQQNLRSGITKHKSACNRVNEPFGNIALPSPQYYAFLSKKRGLIQKSEFLSRS